jgi:hypothetical protein
LLGVLLATALVGGWSAGKAQTRVSEFEIAVDAPRGQVDVTCSRGCEWFRDSGSAVPTKTFTLRCDTERCRWMFNGHGRITLGMPLQPRELIIKR